MARPPTLQIDSLSAFRFPSPGTRRSSSESTITSLSVSPPSPTHQSRHQPRPQPQDRQSQSQEQLHVPYLEISETQPLLQTQPNQQLYYLNITSNSVPTPVLPFLLSPFTPNPDVTKYPSSPLTPHQDATKYPSSPYSSRSSSSGSSTRTQIPFYTRSYSDFLPERGRDSYYSDLEGGTYFDGEAEDEDEDGEEEFLRRANKWCTILTLFLSVLGVLVTLGRWWFYA